MTLNIILFYFAIEPYFYVHASTFSTESECGAEVAFQLFAHPGSIPGFDLVEFSHSLSVVRKSRKASGPVELLVSITIYYKQR